MKNLTGNSMLEFFKKNSSDKKKILLRGPVLTQSGYGVHARQIAQWLLSKNYNVEFEALRWGNTPWLVNTDLQSGLIGKIAQHSVNPKGREYDATIQVQLPNEWSTDYSSVNIGVTAGVECDICNPSWLTDISKMTRVIVPSQFTKSVFEKTAGKSLPAISVVREAITQEVLSSNKKDSPIKNFQCSTSKNFLVFGQLTGNNPENDRKNLFYTIKWFCDNFKDNKDVGLFVKTNAGKNTEIDREVVKKVLADLLNNVRQGELPKVYLIHGELSDREVGGLYRDPKIHALLSLTRGEGYGLPLLEAAACGLPIVSTDFGGQNEFLSLIDYTKIESHLTKIHPSRIDNSIFVKDAKWAQADEQSAKLNMNKIMSGFEKQSPDKLENLRKTFSMNSIFSEYESALGDLI